MNIRVKLFGMLRRSVPGYDPKEGLRLELADGATAGDLLASLDLPHMKYAMVAINNRLVRPDTPLPDDGEIAIIQRGLGG